MMRARAREREIIILVVVMILEMGCTPTTGVTTRTKTCLTRTALITKRLLPINVLTSTLPLPMMDLMRKMPMPINIATQEPLVTKTKMLTSNYRLPLHFSELMVDLPLSVVLAKVMEVVAVVVVLQQGRPRYITLRTKNQQCNYL
jgi:hypothetical protein